MISFSCSFCSYNELKCNTWVLSCVNEIMWWLSGAEATTVLKTNVTYNPRIQGDAMTPKGSNIYKTNKASKQFWHINLLRKEMKQSKFCDKTVIMLHLL